MADEVHDFIPNRRYDEGYRDVEDVASESVNTLRINPTEQAQALARLAARSAYIVALARASKDIEAILADMESLDGFEPAFEELVRQRIQGALWSLDQGSPVGM